MTTKTTIRRVQITIEPYTQQRRRGGPVTRGYRATLRGGGIVYRELYRSTRAAALNAARLVVPSILPRLTDAGRRADGYLPL